MDGERTDPRTLSSPGGLSLAGQDCLGLVWIKICVGQGTAWSTLHHCITDFIFFRLFSFEFF